MTDDLLKAIDESDVASARKKLRTLLSSGMQPPEVHEDLYAAAQRVLNPPFINPHLPKMYRIWRELSPYLPGDDLPGFVELEVVEYARRPKLPDLGRKGPLPCTGSFEDMESAIRSKDLEKTVTLMAAMLCQVGQVAFARRLIMLGSGYLDTTLGHSVSCTAFILLELTDRRGQNPWPALTVLADYFCKGRFCDMPPIESRAKAENAGNGDMARSVSGRGIVNLHHTITRYAIDRVRPFISEEEHNHLLQKWRLFMGDKSAGELPAGTDQRKKPDYDSFLESYRSLDTEAVVTSLSGLIPVPEGRDLLGRFLAKALCDTYNGNYNPHYVTGLGSALWAVNRFRETPVVAEGALRQYVDYLFEDRKHAK